LVQNHGFTDGNKRTAYIIVELFLDRSGYRLVGLAGSREEELEDFIVAIAAGLVPQRQILEWFRLHIRLA
jgi:death on curing protein